MHPVGRSSFYDPTVSWASLIGYVRAVRQFAVTKAPRLPASSLARISAAEGGDPPPAQYLHAPGGRLGYRHYPADSTRRALVLIHGSAGFGDQFQTLARLIARWNLAQVYTLDMRGHGLSEGARGHAVDQPARMVEDVCDFVSHLREVGAADRVILGGHSAGGGLILGVSRHAPELADAYLFLAPFLGVGSPTSRPHFGGWVKVRPLRLLTLMAANLFGVRRFNEATVLDFDDQARTRDPRYVAGWSLNTLLAFGPGRWMKGAPPIPAERPVLVLAGTGDECFHQPLYRQAFKLVAPHAEIPDVGACGHWDLLIDMKSIALTGAWLANQPETQAHKNGAEPSLQENPMKTPNLIGLAVGCAVAFAAHAASAQDLTTKAHDVFFRAGVAAVRFDSGAEFVVAGQPMPGADLKLSNATTGAVEIDYFVHPNVSISLTVGYPPVTHAEGVGQLAPLGRLGSVRFGTGVLQAKYHFGGLGAFQPWIGAGVTRMVIFKNKDGAVQNLDVKDHWGGAVQVGADYMLSPNVGVYGSVSKLFVHTNGTATLGPAPVSAKIDLDPTIWQGGLALKF